MTNKNFKELSNEMRECILNRKLITASYEDQVPIAKHKSSMAYLEGIKKV